MFKGTLSMLASAILLLTPASLAQENGTVGTDQRKIEAIIEDYLIENPEVVVRAIQEFQRRQQLANMLPTIETYRGYLENDPEATVLGNPDGDVTIVEFFDYRCGFCRRHYPSVARLVKEDGNIRYIPKQFPVLDRPNQEPVSRLASLAALAAQKQGKFAEFHNAAMTTGNSPSTEEELYQIAGRIGLDVNRLKADMRDRLMQKRIENNLAIGRDIGFTGTPGYIIGKDVILGAEGYDRLVQAVARARKDKKAAQAAGR